MSGQARAGTRAASGLVLLARNVGESDRVYEILVRSVGRSSVWARQARQGGRRLADALSPFDSAAFVLRPRSEGFSLVRAEVERPRLGLRADLARLQRAGQLAVVAQAICQPSDAADGVLDTLEVAFDHLDAGRLARAAGAYPRLLAHAGVAPDLTACARCDRPLADQEAWALAAPAMVCAGCAPAGVHALSMQARAGLNYQRIEDDSAAAVVEDVVVGWLSYEVGRSLRRGR